MHHISEKPCLSRISEDIPVLEWDPKFQVSLCDTIVVRSCPPRFLFSHVKQWAAPWLKNFGFKLAPYLKQAQIAMLWLMRWRWACSLCLRGGQECAEVQLMWVHSCAGRLHYGGSRQKPADCKYRSKECKHTSNVMVEEAGPISKCLELKCEPGSRDSIQSQGSGLLHPGAASLFLMALAVQLLKDPWVPGDWSRTWLGGSLFHPSSNPPVHLKFPSQCSCHEWFT